MVIENVTQECVAYNSRIGQAFTCTLRGVLDDYSDL